MTLPPSGHAAWDDLTSWWLSRYKASTQRTYATYLPRWNRWCADRRIDPLAARRADVELWLLTVADSGLSRASVAAHYDAVASLYRLATRRSWSRPIHAPGLPDRRSSASCSAARYSQCSSTPPS